MVCFATSSDALQLAYACSAQVMPSCEPILLRADLLANGYPISMIRENQVEAIWLLPGKALQAHSQKGPASGARMEI